MEEGDKWLALDKYEHVLACFLITVFVSSVARRSRHPFLRRRSAMIGSIVSLTAGAAKEAGDEIGLWWESAGASAKDAAADLVGIALANLFLARFASSRRLSDRDPDPDPGISMV